MDCSIPGFPVLCYLPEFAQIHVCWVSDAIWPSHPLLSRSPFASVFCFHYLPEFAQIRVCWVGDAIWPSHPLLSLSPFASVSISIFSIESQLFASGGQSFEASASVPVFPMNIQGWFLLGLTGLISMLFKWLSKVLSSTSIFVGYGPMYNRRRYWVGSVGTISIGQVLTYNWYWVTSSYFNVLLTLSNNSFLGHVCVYS